MTLRLGKFFWKLFLAHAVLLIIVVGVCVGLILSAFQRFYDDEITDYLNSNAEFLRSEIEPILDASHREALDRLVKAVGSDGVTIARITVIAPDGAVLADSAYEPSGLSSHADRPEFQQALRDGVGHSARWSHTQAREMKYAALRIGPPEAPRGVIRTAVVTRGFIGRMRQARELPWVIALIVLAAAILLAWGLVQLWSRPIARITAVARNLSKGDLTSRIPVIGTDELASLALCLNQMRENLSGQLEANYRQRRTLEYLLAQLHEGVIVVGGGGRIMLINPAAAGMLNVSISLTSDGRLVEGLTVEACIPQHEVQRLLVPGGYAIHDGDDERVTETSEFDHASAEEFVQERRIIIRRSTGAITLLARASDIVLPGAVNGALRRQSVGGVAAPPHTETGRLLVLTDITELTRIIQVKTDFVANASHELRTPLTAIRAAVDTLVGMDLPTEAGQATSIIKVIDRHSSRLQDLVSDLLNLSRLESPGDEFIPTRLAFREVINEVYDQFASALQAKGLRWQADFSPEDDRVWVNSQLLRMVLDNLIDNAIKYTDSGGQIRLSAQNQPGRLSITVEDTGCGIPKAEHSRVFERFYQVGRARSGPNRGTGLGLSIVRHAVAAMGGHVDLQSEPGHGTRLTVTIPQPLDHDSDEDAAKIST